ncbi:chaplin family protein [Dactylosporangium sp. NPDC050588]|uniref:chaplin family protein n=1 Tax=Dactylosporangium sp. NPDC050588 TaxID=3157211 RepID=UPI00340E72B2
MKTWVRKSLNVGVLSAGFLLISGGAAHADWTTGYNAGLLNGNQFDTTLQLPVNVCGNSIAVLGFADASCGGGAAAVDTESATTEDWTTGYNAGVANGNQLDTTLQVPVNVSGNAVSVLGFSSASSQGGAYAVKGGMASDNGRGHGHGHGRGHGHGGGNGGGNGGDNGGYTGNNNGGYAAGADDYTESTGNRTEDWTSGYNAGVLNGNQFDTTLQLPVNLSGNAISLFGFSSAQSAGGAWAVKGESASTESATTEDWTTGFNAGLLNGNQFDTTVQAPINVCGNAIAVLGFSSASCGGGAVAVDGDGWGGGNGGGNGHGHGHGHGGGNGDWDDDWDDNGNGGGNGGYGDDDADNNGGYGNGGSNGNPGAYGNAAGNASNMSSHGASASHGKAKTKKVTSEHSRGNGAGTGTANDGGYGNGGGNGQNNGGYGNGNGNNNGGYGNGAGNGDDDRGHGRGHGHGHGNGHGNGGGWSNGGGATAVKNSCSDWTTGYNAGLLNGNQFDTTLQVPVNISGNAISLFGFSQASSQGGAVAYSC